LSIASDSPKCAPFLSHELRHRATVSSTGTWVNAMLVVEIDVLDPQPLQRSFIERGRCPAARQV